MPGIVEVWLGTRFDR